MFTINATNNLGFTAVLRKETDGSVTVSLNEIDLAENAETEETAIYKLAEAIIEYAADFNQDYEYWGSAPNRKDHIPYVLEALRQKDAKKLAEQISIIPE